MADKNNADDAGQQACQVETLGCVLFRIACGSAFQAHIANIGPFIINHLGNLQWYAAGNIDNAQDADSSTVDALSEDGDNNSVATDTWHKDSKAEDMSEEANNALPQGKKDKDNEEARKKKLAALVVLLMLAYIDWPLLMVGHFNVAEIVLSHTASTSFLYKTISLSVLEILGPPFDLLLPLQELFSGTKFIPKIAGEKPADAVNKESQHTKTLVQQFNKNSTIRQLKIMTNLTYLDIGAEATAMLKILDNNNDSIDNIPDNAEIPHNICA
ncbi:hypothetical protein BDN70DRAFT_898891 [Pholiota conissans]|uniref:Uncharacterized protein n=1 Tax=Pholiota conissans TaxID=109636 RepID=A0A9P5YSY6_9AGAR|nr:hypothetical protein BDN70DRAFT_898891 [Pholiota conissans]